MPKPTAPAEAEVFVSVDIEADGPIPGPHSLLSIGAVAMTLEVGVIDRFSVNLQTLPDAAPDPDTARWWAQFPEAWAATRADPQPIEPAIKAFSDWLKRLPGEPRFVGWPASWDFMWIYWYLTRFAGGCPFGVSGIDIRSYVMGMRRLAFRRAGKSYMPKRWQVAVSGPAHIAVHDAEVQGWLFLNALRENLQGV